MVCFKTLKIQNTFEVNIKNGSKENDLNDKIKTVFLFEVKAYGVTK
jgi:hypothetical protein